MVPHQPKEGTMPTDYGYARVSRQDQNLQLQLDALNQAGCWPILQEKRSGVSKERPVRDEILAQLKPGDTLTVWKLDRFGRSVIDLKTIIDDLERRGVRFRCLTQPIDTSSAAGKLFLDILAAFAAFERELIIERTIAGKQSMIAAGKHPGGVPMYGFAADHETIVEEEAELLREAGRRLLDGETLAKIVDTWNKAGIPPRRGQKWRETALREMLINPRVVPIIGQETYDKLARLFANPGNRRQRLGRPAGHLASGILRCGRNGCGQPLYASVKAAKGNHAPQMNYRCHKSGSGGRFDGCGRTAVSLARADEWITEAFIAAVVAPEFTEALNRRRAELLAGEVTVAQVEEWRQEMDELEQVLPTRFAADVHRARHAELQRLVRQATAGLLQRPDLQALLDLPKAEAELRAAWDDWSVAERRQWLKRVLVHVTVLPAPPGTHHRGSDVGARLDPLWKV
jgi:DNA invertase Pin-like site-specific DNA recombinase